MEIEYNLQPTYQDTLEINDESHCVIECINDNMQYFYIYIITSMGLSTIFSMGPITPDADILTQGFSIIMSRLEYDKRKIYGYLSKFINNTKYAIMQAREVELEEMISKIPDIATYIKSCERGEVY